LRETNRIFRPLAPIAWCANYLDVAAPIRSTKRQRNDVICFVFQEDFRPAVGASPALCRKDLLQIGRRVATNRPKKSRSPFSLKARLNGPAFSGRLPLLYPRPRFFNVGGAIFAGLRINTLTIGFSPCPLPHQRAHRALIRRDVAWRDVCVKTGLGDEITLEPLRTGFIARDYGVSHFEPHPFDFG